MSSIRQRTDGRWRARYRDDAGREHSRHFGRKVDAKRWLDGITTAVFTGQYVDPRAGRITFADFYRSWSARQVWAPGTRRAMDLAVRTPFSDLELRSIRRSHVEQWVKTMSGRGLAPGTIHTRANNVRSVLQAAVADRVIPADPSAGVTLPRRRRAEAAMSIPTAEQVGALLDHAEGPFVAFLGLYAFAGLRLGEAAGVQIGDVDFLGRTVSISRQVQRENAGRLDIRAPKWGSERTVYLADGIVSMLAEHVRLHAVTVAGAPPWLFSGDMPGMPPHQNTVGHRWRTTLARAGLTGTKLHDLRHFYASGLIAQGCDVVTVQRSLGHTRATTTLNTYAHLWPTAEDRTRAAAEAMLNQAQSGILADSSRTLERE